MGVRTLAGDRRVLGLLSLLSIGLACAGAPGRAPAPPATEPASAPELASAPPAPPAPPPWSCRIDAPPHDRPPAWAYGESHQREHDKPPPSVRDSFSRAVTASVVAAGVAGALPYIDDWNGDEQGGYDPAWDARLASYQTFFTPCERLVDDARPDCPEDALPSAFLHETDPASWLWRRSVVTEVERHLSDPDRLWAAWQEHRGTVIDTVAKAGKQQELRSFLQEVVLPALREPIGPELCDALGERARRWEHLVTDEWVEDEPDRLQAWMETRQRAKLFTSRSLAVLEFANRRGAEGGQPLVDAWIRVVEDLDRGLGER